jgi:hypothetical protein
MLIKKKLKSYIEQSVNAYAILLRSFRDEQVLLVNNIYPGNAYMVWQVINDRYGVTKQTATLSSILLLLSTTMKLEHESLSAYLARMKQYLLDCKSLQHDYDETLYIYNVIRGLKNYEETKKMIEFIEMSGIENISSSDELENKLTAENNRRKSEKVANKSLHIRDDTNHHAHVSDADRGRGRGRGRGRAHGSNRSNWRHNNNNNNDNNNNNTDNKKCYTCGKPWQRGHQCQSSSNNNNNNNINDGINAAASSAANNNNNNNNNKKNILCHRCMGLGHTAKDCKSTPVCGTCYKIGHDKLHCYNNANNNNNRSAAAATQQVNNNNNNNNSNDSGFSSCVTQLASLTHHACSATNQSLTKKNEWAGDSAASHHHTPYLDILSNIQHVSLSTTTANGQSIITAIGDIYMNICGHKIVLRNVAYCKDFTANLLSVVQLDKHGYSITCKNNIMGVSKNNDLLMIGKKKGGLYIFKCKYNNINTNQHATHTSMSSSTTSPSHTLTSLKDELRSLHYKCGHRSYSKLYDMIK